MLEGFVRGKFVITKRQEFQIEDFVVFECVVLFSKYSFAKILFASAIEFCGCAVHLRRSDFFYYFMCSARAFQVMPVLFQVVIYKLLEAIKFMINIY